MDLLQGWMPIQPWVRSITEMPVCSWVLLEPTVNFLEFGMIWLTATNCHLLSRMTPYIQQACCDVSFGHWLCLFVLYAMWMVLLTMCFMVHRLWWWLWWGRRWCWIHIQWEIWYVTFSALPGKWFFCLIHSTCLFIYWTSVWYGYSVLSYELAIHLKYTSPHLVKLLNVPVLCWSFAFCSLFGDQNCLTGRT